MKSNVVSTPTRPKKPTASKVPWHLKVHVFIVDLQIVLIDITLMWLVIDGIWKFVHPTLGHLSVLA